MSIGVCAIQAQSNKSRTQKGPIRLCEKCSRNEYYDCEVAFMSSNKQVPYF